MAGRQITAIALLVLALSAGAIEARKARPPAGTLTLDMNAPIVIATVAGVDLRLRVAPEQRRLIELNRAAAHRLALPYEKGSDAQVGREIVASITAAARVRINGRDFVAQIDSHDRDCCRDVDGEIGMALLPYAVVRLVRGAGGDRSPVRSYLIEDSSERGPETRLRSARETIFATFSLTRAQSVATYSAASILASAYGGTLQKGTTGDIEAAFGVRRPARTLKLENPADVAGFRFKEIPVRIADFGGRYDFPDDAAAPGDIVVAHRVTPQIAWPLVLIGRDRLDRCHELRFDRIASTIELRCDPETLP